VVLPSLLFGLLLISFACQYRSPFVGIAAGNIRCRVHDNGSGPAAR
jgi:hypothetical protein